MRRRDLILAAAAALGTPLHAHAQPAPLVGFLHGSAPSGPYPGYVESFAEGLRQQGLEPDRNVSIAYRWAAGRYDRIPGLARELLSLDPSVMVTYGPPNVVKAAIDAIPRTMPVVFGTGGDPVAAGIVPNLARPVGNVTGVANRTNALDVKRLELLRDLLPEIATVGLIVNPKNSDAAGVIEAAQVGARSLQRRLVIAGGSTVDELDNAFQQVKQQGAGAVLLASDTYFNAESTRIVALAARHRMPAIYNGRAFTEMGGLISYGANFAENYRLIGVAVGRILNGAKTTDIPVIEPTRFELVINLRAAKALGLTIPPLILTRADEVIE
jgi:putative ABC transport system substrate-binding protein